MAEASESVGAARRAVKDAADYGEGLNIDDPTLDAYERAIRRSVLEEVVAKVTYHNVTGYSGVSDYCRVCQFLIVEADCFHACPIHDLRAALKDIEWQQVDG